MNDAEHLERFRRLGDEQIIRLDAALQPGAIEVLYERHHAVAYTFAVRIVGSPDQAKDVVYDAFLSL